MKLSHLLLVVFSIHCSTTFLSPAAHANQLNLIKRITRPDHLKQPRPTDNSPDGQRPHGTGEVGTTAPGTTEIRFPNDMKDQGKFYVNGLPSEVKSVAADFMQKPNLQTLDLTGTPSGVRVAQLPNDDIKPNEWRYVRLGNVTNDKKFEIQAVPLPAAIRNSIKSVRIDKSTKSVADEVTIQGKRFYGTPAGSNFSEKYSEITERYEFVKDRTNPNKTFRVTAMSQSQDSDGFLKVKSTLQDENSVKFEVKQGSDANSVSRSGTFSLPHKKGFIVDHRVIEGGQRLAITTSQGDYYEFDVDVLDKPNAIEHFKIKRALELPELQHLLVKVQPYSPRVNVADDSAAGGVEFVK